MRISTEVVRTPYGIDRTAVQASWYGPDVFASEKAKQFERHQEALVPFAKDSRFLSSVSGHAAWEENYGISCEWWTVVVYDLDSV